MNVVVLMGRLTADPELKHTSNDIPVTSFSIAVNRKFSKSAEERQADFINIVAWRNTADFICKYFKKGQMIAIEGSIQTRSYQDKDGNKRVSFDVVANNVHFTESKRSSGEVAPRPDVVAEKPPEERKAEFSPYVNGSSDDFQTIESDEDLPF